MSGPSLLSSLGPSRLARAREMVVAAHPGTAAAPVAVAPDKLAALRRRVAEAGPDREALARLARELAPREVRALVTGLEQWEELRPACAYLLHLRARRGLLVPLWRAWQRFPAVALLRKVLLYYAREFGWEEAAGSAYAELAAEWAADEEPGLRIREWLDGLGKSYSDLPEMSACPLLLNTPLLLLVRGAVLTDGSAAQLEREGGARLHTWSAELGPAQRVRFGRNYLMRIPAADWHRPILDRIEATYGLPRRPKLASFWDGVPEEIRLAFQRIFIGEKLRRAFHDDTDRYEYWMRWSDAFADVQLARAGTVDYAILHFEDFGVVEFFQVGNAAYFYEREQLERIARVDARTPSDLRDLYYPRFAGGEDNRLIHSPNGRWYGKASRQVRLWIKATK